MVRFTSTERAKQGDEEEGSAKFARGSRLSMGEQVRCYREECQRIFDLQNRVLSNPELLSSDEEVSSEEDEDEVNPCADGAAAAATVGGVRGPGADGSTIGGVRLSSLPSNTSSRPFGHPAPPHSHRNPNINRQDSGGDRLKRMLEGSVSC